MKVNLGQTRKARIEMLPLIDIVFLLLVFFIYAMLSMAVHRSLPVSLPSSSTSGVDEDAAIMVTVKPTGAIHIEEQEIPIDSLADTLKRIVGGGKDPGIFLFADKSLEYQMLFRVLDEIRAAGINRISLQAELEQHR